MKEIWKPINIENFNHYEVSTFGRIRNKNGLIMKQRLGSNGYLIIDLHSKGISKTFSVHRIVAITFIPNPNNLTEVNHKDENIQNPRVDNLEWCNKDYNCNYGTRNERLKQAHKGIYDGENNPMYGKVHSKESKNKMSKNHYDCSGKNNPKSRRVICNGVLYETMLDCSNFYGINKSTMCCWLKGVNNMPKRFKEMDLKYFEEEKENKQ